MLLLYKSGMLYLLDKGSFSLFAFKINDICLVLTEAHNMAEYTKARGGTLA